VSLISDDLLKYDHQRGRSHAQHDYAIDGFEWAPQASPHILCDIKESSGRGVIPEGIVQAA